MSGNNRDRIWPSGQVGSAAEQSDAWHVDRELLWVWIDDLLDAVPIARIDEDLLRGLCAQALDTHAPAVLVHAQAAGVLLEHLIAAAVAQAYADRYGHPGDDLYEVARLRAVVGDLRRAAMPAA